MISWGRVGLFYCNETLVASEVITQAIRKAETQRNFTHFCSKKMEARYMSNMRRGTVQVLVLSKILKFINTSHISSYENVNKFKQLV